MIQRAIGVTIGAIVTLVLLWALVDVAVEDAIAAVAIGAVAAWAWPVVIAFWLGRRAKQRRDDKIESEVQKQLDEERKNQG